jgi:hypothetical protein
MGQPLSAVEHHPRAGQEAEHQKAYYERIERESKERYDQAQRNAQ